jgi:feruloyl esterase
MSFPASFGRPSPATLDRRFWPGLWLRLPFSRLFSFLLTVACSVGARAEPDSDSAKAEALWGLTIENGRIHSVEHTDSPTHTNRDNQTIGGLPPRTIVRWSIYPAKGSQINAEMWLPDAANWSERFLGLGNGGSAGSINPDGFVGPLRENFAVATTDMGTAPNSESGIGNREVWKDFGFRATHLMTVTAKQILRSYYGREPKFSYFNGGSTGGQQALQEAQRYPEDYDGIVAFIPAHCRTPLHAYFLWNDHILDECKFTDAQEANIVAAGNEYMAPREAPEVAGKFVSDPRCTSEDINAVVQLAMKKDPTITAAQADGLRKLFDGPKHSVTGERIFCGIPFGSTLKNAHGHLYLFKWVFGRDKDLNKINFAEDIDTYTAALGPYLNAENADLKPFEKRGGKILIVPGSADSVVPYHASIDYYERVVAECGGLDKVRSFARLFIIPGRGHSGGPGIIYFPSLLRTVMDWREEGVAPDKLLGKRVVDKKVELEMPIYPYPAKAQWSAESKTYEPVEGPRGGVDPIAKRFRPAAAD